MKTILYGNKIVIYLQNTKYDKYKLNDIITFYLITIFIVVAIKNNFEFTGTTTNNHFLL